jgi:hydrogenase/urease accessory protein HupE
MERSGMSRNKLTTACLCSIVLPSIFLWPDKAYAHLMSTGFGPFYDGIIHLTMSPDDLLGVLALALLAGLAGASYGRTVLFCLTSAWLMGGLIGLQLDQEVLLPLVNTLSFFIVGLLVALDRKLSLWLVTCLSIVLGLFHGFFNGSAMSEAGGGILALLGIATGVFVVVAIAAAFVTSLHQTWTRIAVRIAGSWIAAIGLLLMGWTFRGGLSP